MSDVMRLWSLIAWVRGVPAIVFGPARRAGCDGYCCSLPRREAANDSGPGAA